MMQSSPPIAEGEQVYITGQLLETPERKIYRDGEILLSIPKIGVENIPVLSLPNPFADGEDAVDDRLLEGIGLLFCSQMPGTGNPNVGIAGFTGTDGREFSRLQEIAAKDRIYLEYSSRRFEYEYVYTMFIDREEELQIRWAPFMTKEFSAITLQAYDPIEMNGNIVFISGKLIDIKDLS